MGSKATGWKSPACLETDEDIQRYLAGCLEKSSENPALIVHALGVIARTRNMSRLARDTGLTREGLYKAFSPGGNPGFVTVVKVAKALGLRITVQVTQEEPSSQQRDTISDTGI